MGKLINGYHDERHITKALLKKHKITQKEFAEYCGVSLNTIHRMLNSGSYPVYIRRLAKSMVGNRVGL